jgi:hypothetical protein
MPEYIVKRVIEVEEKILADSDAEALAISASLDGSVIDAEKRNLIEHLGERILDARVTHIINLNGIAVSMDLIRRRRREALGHE